MVEEGHNSFKIFAFSNNKLKDTNTHLCEHGLSILGDHGALITVQGDKVIVEGLLGMFQHIVELSGAAFEYTPKVPRNQRPANRFRGGKKTQRALGRKELLSHRAQSIWD